MAIIENLEAMLAKGMDNALLRYSLGSAYQQEGKLDESIKHLAKALEFDPGYSAAWKLYGKALAQNGHVSQAAEAYRSGIGAAEQKGDLQAAKEMAVFLRRLEKQLNQK